MNKTKFFKKILPSILIVTIFATGFFGAFGVSVVNAQKDGDSSVTGCSLKIFKFNIKKCFRTILASLGEVVLEFFAIIVGLSGKLLNVVVEKTVIKMGVNFSSEGANLGGVVREAWKVFRDLANILIIFALLMIGIATILRSEKYGAKKLLANLIIVAILINFSLFFTNIVIDSSNLLAVQFYNKVRNTETDGWNGFSDSYMQAFRLTTLYDHEPDFSDVVNNNLNVGQIFLLTILGSILFLVVAFSFFAGVFLLLSRYVVLIFLMILSPIAFVGMVFPAMQGKAKQWTDMLFKYSFFAPIHFLLTWLVITIINSGAFKESIGLLGEDGENFSSLTAGDPKSINMLLNFVIVIFFIIASLIISNRLGIAGSKTVINWGQFARKWGQGVVGRGTFGATGGVLRNTLGRGASKLSDSEKIKDRAASGGIKGVFGRMQLRGLRGVASSSFDVRATSAGKGVASALDLGKAVGKGGYQEKLKQQIKEREKFAESLGEENLAERQKKKGLKQNVISATKTFESAQEKEKQARIKMENTIIPEQKEIEKKKLEALTKEKEMAQKLLDNATAVEKVYSPGSERKRQYTGILESESTLDTLFTKVARKNKEAAGTIRKDINNFKKKKDIKDLASVIMEEIDKDKGESKEEKEA